MLRYGKARIVVPNVCPSKLPCVQAYLHRTKNMQVALRISCAHHRSREHHVVEKQMQEYST